tara:strand:- start:46 stop:234 length:189 start_codon:yes stop_codon:yes gene_type:complete
MPPSIVNHKEKEVYFYIPNGMPTTMGIPNWMRSFPDGYRGLVVKNKDYFDQLKKESKDRDGM